jgi:chromosome segregation ATPase
MLSRQSPVRRRLPQVSRSSSSATPIIFGLPKPVHEVRPSEIHDLRVEIIKVQTETKLKQTALNRLKERIIEKTDAINRTVKQQNGGESGPKSGSAIPQLTRSLEVAQHACDKLQLELQEAQCDDRTAFYQEVEEELRATFLEYERLQQELNKARQEAQSYEVQLEKIDYRASAQNAEDLERTINQLKGSNRALRSKWEAYHLKMQKMDIDARSSANRRDNVNCQDTVESGSMEYNEEVDKLNNVADQLDQVDLEYRQHADRLTEIIDNQRRAIVQFLMGKREQNETQ